MSVLDTLFNRNGQCAVMQFPRRLCMLCDNTVHLSVCACDLCGRERDIAAACRRHTPQTESKTT